MMIVSVTKAFPFIFQFVVQSARYLSFQSLWKEVDYG